MSDNYCAEQFSFTFSFLGESKESKSKPEKDKTDVMN
jgi:hypothetical protein